jgi:hypothetical protein
VSIVAERFGCWVSTFLRNRYQAIEQVEWVEWIEKCERFVYSMNSGMLLKRRGLLRTEGSSPFFGTSEIIKLFILKVNG